MIQIQIPLEAYSIEQTPMRLTIFICRPMWIMILTSAMRLLSCAESERDLIILAATVVCGWLGVRPSTLARYTRPNAPQPSTRSDRHPGTRG